MNICGIKDLNIRAALLDLDGTLVLEDMLDVVCDITSKREESEKLNQAFRDGVISGTDSLVGRINLLKGISLRAINEKLQENPYLREGAKELVDYLKTKGIVTAIQSRNIVPVLEYYQHALGIDYALGTSIVVSKGIIQGDPIMPLLKKYESAQIFLDQQRISPKDVLAMGDSMGDRKVFELAGMSIAVSPRDDIVKYATHVIYGDLRNAIPIIERILTN
jgi:phosphoserine phosphatase